MYRPTNEPNYVAKKTVFLAFRWWIFLVMIPSVTLLILTWVTDFINNSTAKIALTVLFGVCAAVPLFVFLWYIIVLKHHYIEFYDNYVIEKWGVFNKHSKKTIFPKITSVTTSKNILGFGNVMIDVVGPTWDVNFDDITRPNDLRDFLEYHMLGDAAIENISNNPYIAATDGVFG